MSTTIRIAGWESRGLRCPDHRISLEMNSGGETYPVSLIQMPNGTGKTTTLRLLRAALSGARGDAGFGREDVTALRKQERGREKGSFQVRLVVDDRTVTITLEFDFGRGDVKCFTTLQSGMKTGFHPPRASEALLSAEVVDFFVFNGELAERLVDKKYTNAETAIDCLFHLTAFQRLVTQVEEYWQEKTRDRTAVEQKGLNRRRNRVDRLEKLIATRVKERARLKSRLEKIEERLADREEEFVAGLRAHKERERHVRRLERAEGSLRAAMQKKETVIGNIVSDLRDPAALAAAVVPRLESFRLSLDQVKLPESAAREFFSELAQQKRCVCGREIDQRSRRAIEQRAARYLGSAEVALLNAMKTDISDANRQEVPSYSSLKGHIQDLLATVGDVSRLRTQRDAISAEAAEGDPNLEAVQKEVKSLEGKKRDLERELRRFDDEADSAGDNETVGITVLRRRLGQAEKLLAEITETLEIKQQRDELKSILIAARTRARTVLRDRIRRESNARIATLMPNNRIRIGKIEQCLFLDAQEAGSTGENLSVAYAFLASLFDGAESGLPFVVDSPAESN